MKFTQSHFAVALAFAAGILTACNFHGSDVNAAGAGDTSQLRLIGITKKAHGAAMAQRTESTTQSTQAAATNPSACANLGVSMAQDPLHTSVITFQTCTGYMYGVDADTDKITSLNSVYYTQANCNGTALLIQGTNSGQSFSPSVKGNGIVFMRNDGSAAYMVAGATPQTDTALSVENAGGSCFNTSLTGDFFYETQDNDPAVTGIDPTDIVGVISFVAPGG